MWRGHSEGGCPIVRRPEQFEVCCFAKGYLIIAQEVNWHLSKLPAYSLYWLICAGLEQTTIYFPSPS